MEEQDSARQVSEIQKPSKKWLIPASLAVVAAGVFLYSYLAPAQNDDGTGGEGEQTQSGKTVVVYTRTRDGIPTQYDKKPRTIEIVAANIDGTDKKVLFAGETQDSPLYMLVSATGEFIYVRRRDSFQPDLPIPVFAISLADGSAQRIFEGLAIHDMALSPDGKKLGILVADWVTGDDSYDLRRQNTRFVTISLGGGGQHTEVPLAVKEEQREFAIASWEDDGRLMLQELRGTDGGGTGELLVFDVEGQRISSPFEGLPYGRPHHISPDGKWFLFTPYVTDSSVAMFGYRGSGLHAYLATSVPPVVIETEGGFSTEQWTKDSKAVIYSWSEETEVDTDVRGEFRFLFPATNSDGVSVYLKRYTTFDIATQEKNTFATRGELNAYLKDRHPDEYRYEIIYEGRVEQQGVEYLSGTPQYRIVTSAVELWVDGVLVDRTENEFLNEIEVLGFSEI